MNSVILREDAQFNVIDEGNIVLLYSFYKPQVWEREGLDNILRGLVFQRHRKIGLTRVNGTEYFSHFAHCDLDYRNALFGGLSLDPGAEDIQRSRDHGMPLYNEARAHYGLPLGNIFSRVGFLFSVATKFSDISSNPKISAALEAVYGDVNRVEAFVGGLAEDHIPKGAVGVLFAQSIARQVVRLRDGGMNFLRASLTNFRSVLLEKPNRRI